MCEYFVSMCALCVLSYDRNYMMFVFSYVTNHERKGVVCIMA
jgi:hypothetical protein